jgi:hypothetical protein
VFFGAQTKSHSGCDLPATSHIGLCDPYCRTSLRVSSSSPIDKDKGLLCIIHHQVIIRENDHARLLCSHGPLYTISSKLNINFVWYTKSSKYQSFIQIKINCHSSLALSIPKKTYKIPRWTSKHNIFYFLGVLYNKSFEY